MAKVNFKRLEDSGLINNVPIEDGSFIVTKDGKIYIDYGENRTSIGGTPDTEMSDRSTNTVENNVIKSYVDTNVSTINKNLGGKRLWTNLNPQNEFIGQTITLSSSDYDMLLWLFRTGTNASQIISEYSIKNYGVKVNNIGANNVTRRREITRINDYRYNIGSCMSEENSYENTALIPIAVIGYKTGLFS